MAFRLKSIWDPERVVPQEVLEGLKHYKYASIDKSILSRLFLARYWSYCATWAPRWMAPNLITLIGFCLVLLNIPITLYFSPDLSTPGPLWMYWSAALGIWFYSVMDNIDGKQARRTGMSSPLGELFDHGVDSLNCCLGVLLQCAAVGLGYSWMSMGLLGMTSSVFYFSTWESYHTKVLYFGPISGPSEGVVISCSAIALSGLFGPQVWWTPIRSAVPGLSWILKDILGLEDLTLVQVAFSGMAFLLFTTQLPTCGLCAAWLASPYSRALDTYFVPFFLANGVVFGRMGTFMILAHVTHSKFPNLYNLLLPALGGTLLVYSPYYFPRALLLVQNIEDVYIYAYLTYAIVSYLVWAKIVIDRICGHLGIPCLTIPREKWMKIE